MMSDVHRRFLLDGVHHSRKKSARKRETAARAEHQSRAASEHQSGREGNDGKKVDYQILCLTLCCKEIIKLAFSGDSSIWVFVHDICQRAILINTVHRVRDGIF